MQWIRERALSIVFFVLFVLALAGATVSGWMEYAADARAHGSTPQLLGEDGYLPILSEQVAQNVQSEFLALAALVVLSASLIHRGSAHSKDGQEEVQARVQAIRRRIDALERAGRS